MLANTLITMARAFISDDVWYSMEPFTWSYLGGGRANETVIPRHRRSDSYHRSLPYYMWEATSSCPLLDEVLGVEAEVLVVKFTMANGRFPLLARYEPDVWIHLYRNPLWVLNSIAQINFDLGTIGKAGQAPGHDWRWWAKQAGIELPADRLDRNALRWVKDHEYVVAYPQLPPVLLSYDKFCKAPQQGMRDLAGLLVSDWSAHADLLATLAEGVRPTSKEMVLSKADKRRFSALCRPVYRQLDQEEEWRW